MIEAEKRIREALAAGPTPGKWHLFHRHNTTEVQKGRNDPIAPIVSWPGFDGCDRSRAAYGRDARYIAACNPTNIAALLADRDEREEKLLSEIDRLRARLEVDPRHSYDGIACRDETIRQQDQRIDRLTRERDEARAEREALAKALRELLEAEGASFPNAILGRAAQDAWADRKANAREQARAALAQIEQERSE